FRLERGVHSQTIGQYERLVDRESGRDRINNVELDGRLQKELSCCLHIVAMNWDAQARHRLELTEDRHFGGRPCPFQPGFKLPNSAKRMPEQAVYCRVKNAARM